MATTRDYKSSKAQRKASKKYDDANRDKIRARLKVYYLANAEKLREKRRVRYQLKKLI